MPRVIADVFRLIRADNLDADVIELDGSHVVIPDDADRRYQYDIPGDDSELLASKLVIGVDQAATRVVLGYTKSLDGKLILVPCADGTMIIRVGSLELLVSCVDSLPRTGFALQRRQRPSDVESSEDNLQSDPLSALNPQ